MTIHGSRPARAAGFLVAALIAAAPALIRAAPTLIMAAPALIMAAPAWAQTVGGDDALVRKGEYIATLGDCVACHTAEGGKPFAGGLALKTPTGTIYSTNITPEKKTGVGNYTFEQFDAATRRGVAADGHYLYPAMPYPSFAKVTDEDMQALYAYFMNAVAPVEQANKPSEMHFPFNIRLAMFGWNLLFLEKEPYKYNVKRSTRWNRGAYLVEGLGHCGACHTPRGFAMQEKAYSDDGKDFLDGSTLYPWRSIGLRRLYSEDDLVRLLRTGTNGHDMVYGPMAEVVHYSSQHFTEEDLHAISRYLMSLTPDAAERPDLTGVSEPELYGTRGGLGYLQFCASCHGYTGTGAPGVFPTLARNPSALSDDPTSVIHIVLSGGTSPETVSTPHQFSMPAYAQLGDREIAEILTFVRSSWGNRSSAVTETQVRDMRTELELGHENPSPTPRFTELLGNKDKDKLVYGMRLMNETKKLLPDNVGDALNCSSCHINGGTVPQASPYFGLTALFPSKNPRAGKVIDMEDRINGCFKRSMAGTALAKESREMLAMVAFMDWMRGDAKPGVKIDGRGTEKIPNSVKPDPVRGEKIYHAECAVCHGENGEGMKNAKGELMFPPLWGDESFNIGAGMARTYTAAGFIKSNMPIAYNPHFPQNQGGLSDQDAVDVAEYFTHQPRKDFPEKINDWPNGGKPADSRY